MTILKMENISKSFHVHNEQINVLNNFSLELEAGEIVALWGASGTGKTTILNLLGTFTTPDTGEIFYDTSAYSKFSQKEIASFRLHNLAVVWQENNLITNLTARENILIGYPLEYTDKTINALKYLSEKLNISELLDKFPGQLSGGERQRVTVLRALLKNPKIVLADEPTASLDWENAKTVFSLFIEITRELNATLVVATHDIRIAKLCDYTINLQKNAKHPTTIA